MTTIYVLKLDQGKIYVGRSVYPSERILNHFKYGGCEWTKLYKPIEVLEKVPGDAFDEEKYTLIYMDKYGVDNVRGGSYCRVNLPQYEKEKALQVIRSFSDKCYKCGEQGHFAKDCNPTEVVEYKESEMWKWIKTKLWDSYLFVTEVPPAGSQN